MDASAINEIQNTAIDAQRARIPSAFADKVIALPDDYRLHDLEQFGDGRRRFRGSLLTNSLADFIGYVKQHRGEGFIDADKLAATVFFNLGDKVTPGHADWRATLAMKPTAAYVAMCKLDGQPQTQRALIDFLEDWGLNLVPLPQEGDEAPSMAKAITAIRSITIKATSEAETTQGDFRAARSALDEVEAKSRHNLPAGFTFTTEPYQGLPSREFRLRLSVLTDTKDPRLVLRIVQKEAQVEAIAQDFKRVLLAEVGDAAALTIGAFTP